MTIKYEGVQESERTGLQSSREHGTYGDGTGQAICLLPKISPGRDRADLCGDKDPDNRGWSGGYADQCELFIT